jgi:hypothetical protein
MEALFSLLIGIAVFALIAIIVSWKYRNAVLEKLESLPEETTRFEENGVQVVQLGGTRPVVFMSCLVRATNRRLIIAQKPLFGTKRMLRFVINYRNPEGQGTSVKSALSVGYMVGDIPATRFTKELDNETPYVHFPLGGGMITAQQSVQIFTQNPDELLAVLQGDEG